MLNKSICLGIAAGVLLAAAPAVAQDVGWSYFGSDKAFSRYSPADQIDASNVDQLEVAWRRSAVDADLAAAFPDRRFSAYLLSTPILHDGLLYAQDAVGYVQAFSPTTGATVWKQAPLEMTVEEVLQRSARGVDVWTDARGADRILSVRGEYLYALDAATGEPVAGFGDGGRVFLRGENPDARTFNAAAGLIVVDDVVVIGGIWGGAGDRSPVRERDPGNVRGFSASTGEHLWTFHVTPRPGEVGFDSWESEAWQYAGDMGSWCCLSADTELGYVYAPLSAPTGFFGGHRPGDNLFSNSVVALNAATGELEWYFQMTHHGIWEYENMGPPILGDIQVGGRNVPALMQPNKNAFLFVLNRETGEPVWPIVERPVPESTVPGEVASPTQPFPTRPPAFDRQGMTEDDLIDFTPEIRAEALAFFNRYVHGPLYTPPSIVSHDGGTEGTLSAPGSWGAANWNTGAFDPETDMYYAVSHTLPGVDGIVRATDPEATFEYVREGSSPVFLESGLPVTKPPYGRITAIDLTVGDEAWMVPNGDGPRDHPLLRDLDLPPLGTAGRPTALLTRTLLFLGEGSNAISGTGRDYMWGNTFRAYDKATGEVVWETELDAGTTTGPMTYIIDGKQYIVVAIGATDHPAEWVALALP